MGRSTLAFALAGLLASAALHAESEVIKGFRASIPAAGVSEVAVDIPIAEIEIVNGPSSTIEIEGTIRQKYHGRDEKAWAAGIVDATEVVLEARGGRALVRREVGAQVRGWKAKRSPSTIRLLVRAPEGTSLEVDQSIGELAVDGSFGHIDIELRIGEIRVRIPKRAVRSLSASAKIGEVETNLGDRIITKEGLFAGETLYENESGRHEVRVRVQIGEIDIELR